MSWPVAKKSYCKSTRKFIIFGGITLKIVSYAGDGNNQMDKASGNTYTNGDQSITIESCFIGTNSIHNLLKQFIKEQNNVKIEVANTTPPQYNDSGNTVVAASAKEGGE